MAMNINSEVKTEENATVSVKVSVPKEIVEQELNTTLEEYTKKVTLPGFRKGKAPKKMVFKKYKRDIEVESIEKILNDAVKEVIQEKDIKIYSRPQITDMDNNVSKSNDFNFEFKVEVLPTVELPEYKGIDYEKIIYKYTDEDVEERLKQLQQNEAMVVDKEDEPIKQDDKVTFDYNFFLIGKTEQEPEGHKHITVGNEPEEEWLKPIHEDLEGQSAGYEATYDILIPKNHPNEKLAGKQGKVYIKVTKVESVDIPEIDDDLAKDLDYDDLNALKESIKEELQKECENITDEENSFKIIDKIINEAKFEIPESLINDEAKHQKDYFLSMFGGDPETIESYIMEGDSKEEFEKRFRENAIDIIKRELVTDRVIDKEELNASDEEIDKQIQDYAEKYNITPDKMKKEFEKNNAMFRIRRGIELDKLNHFLIENSNATEEEEKTLTQMKEERNHLHDHHDEKDGESSTPSENEESGEKE